ncbi:sodium:proton antiporter [Arenicella chitinivorans]|uniref:Sodium:proton antiporter n=1 Tax=Arenicella chitinivorans TaxID=1329800 RepID=A0A918S091_9GAMM|nr:sodium:proton antiporter [Arenicella chitinivorans]
MLFLDIVSGILLIAGVFFGLSGAVGLFRFPDFYTRVHAASVTDSIAAILLISGFLLQTSFDLNTAKLLFILAFLLITSPTASHALAKSARHGGLLAMAETNQKKPRQDM